MQVDPKTVRTTLARVFKNYPDNRFFAESRKLYDANRPTAEMIQAFSLRPEIMEGLAVLARGVYPGGLLERSLGERVLLEISRLNECQFCVASHEYYIRALGISETPLEDLVTGGKLTERERAAIDYARAILKDSNRIPQELKDRLRALFTEPEVVELTFTVGIFNTLNWFNNALDNRYRGEYEGTIEPISRTPPRGRAPSPPRTSVARQPSRRKSSRR